MNYKILSFALAVLGYGAVNVRCCPISDPITILLDRQTDDDCFNIRRCEAFVPFSVGLEVQNAISITFVYILENGGFVEHEKPLDMTTGTWQQVTDSLDDKVDDILITIEWNPLAETENRAYKIQSLDIMACINGSNPDAFCLLVVCQEEIPRPVVSDTTCDEDSSFTLESDLDFWKSDDWIIYDSQNQNRTVLTSALLYSGLHLKMENQEGGSYYCIFSVFGTPDFDVQSGSVVVGTSFGNTIDIVYNNEDVLSETWNVDVPDVLIWKTITLPADTGITDICISSEAEFYVKHLHIEACVSDSVDASTTIPFLFRCDFTDGICDGLENMHGLWQASVNDEIFMDGEFSGNGDKVGLSTPVFDTNLPVCLHVTYIAYGPSEISIYTDDMGEAAAIEHIANDRGNIKNLFEDLFLQTADRIYFVVKKTSVESSKVYFAVSNFEVFEGHCLQDN